MKKLFSMLCVASLILAAPACCWKSCKDECPETRCKRECRKECPEKEMCCREKRCRERCCENEKYWSIW